MGEGKAEDLPPLPPAFVIHSQRLALREEHLSLLMVRPGTQLPPSSNNLKSPSNNLKS